MNRELKHATADTLNAVPAPARRPAAAPRCFGVIGGLGPLASADVFFKLVKATPAASDAEHLDLIFEQRPFRGPQHSPRDGAPDYTARKLYIFDMIRTFERRGAHAVILPCFLSHTFIEELKANSALPIVDMVEALRAQVRSKYPGVRRIGVLASDYTRGAGLFERYFKAPEFQLLHARTRTPDAALSAVDAAVYGTSGIKAGQLGGAPLEWLAAACADLIEQGAEVIVPGLTEIAIVIEALRAHLGEAVPLLDANLIYARYAISGAYARAAKPFKIGVLGGVGPAATVDFVRKLVAHTPAACDQDHIKLIVEQNPQIPDRTENLLGQGPDPTIALYATCKKLEAGDADLIAIPCNTAHAFVERIQPYLSIPIVNMLNVTAEHVRARFPELRQVGLLATSGTVASGVYRQALAAVGLTQVVPGALLQARVMNAIYGPQGIKAGYTRGACLDDIRAALDDLIEAGVRTVILGCTELPLLFEGACTSGSGGTVVELIDPTLVLALRCIEHAQAAQGAPFTAGFPATRC